MNTTFFAEKEIEVSSFSAWTALTEMSNWLTRLHSIFTIDYDKKYSFFVEGREYKVLTPEKITMTSQLVKINEKQMIVTIQAHFFVLHSQLVCKVIPLSATKYLITRKQEYLGLVGKVFAILFKKREGNETNEYLMEWEKYAISSLLNDC